MKSKNIKKEKVKWCPVCEYGVIRNDKTCSNCSYSLLQGKKMIKEVTTEDVKKEQLERDGGRKFGFDPNL